MAIYGYCRVSTGRQAAEGESLGVQRRQIEGYAHMHGWAVDATFVEEGVSGSKPLGQRPEGARLLARLTSGDMVVAAKLDRVFRSALDALQMVEEFRKRGVRLHLIDLGGDISGNGLSRLFLTIAAAFAEAERDRIRERVATVKADQRQRGRYLGGRVPFGYVVSEAGSLVPDEAQQRAIQFIQVRQGEGVALRTIAREVRERFGLRLSHTGVQNVLRAG